MSPLLQVMVWWVLWAVTTLDIDFMDLDKCDADFDMCIVDSIVANFGFS